MELRADCGNCLALCCVALAFASPADFAISKPAGEPCPNLAEDLRCGIHDRLRESGFGGCEAYDCFGAGQRVSATVSGDWRTSATAAAELFAALPIVTRLHELLWYLADAAGRDECRPLAAELAEATARVDALAATPVLTDPESARRAVAPLLERASLLVRVPAGRELRHTDLAGRDLRKSELNAADLRGADLGSALFVTSAQVGAADGDAHTVLPDRVVRPSRWG